MLDRGYEIARLTGNSHQASLASSCRHRSTFGGRPDPMRRFTATPFATELHLMDHTIRVETNEARVLEFAQSFFKRHRSSGPSKAEFLWRIVCEPDSAVGSTDLPLEAFSGTKLRYASIGHRSFLAVDLQKREAVAFLSEVFFERSEIRNSRPLDLLFCLTAPCLQLTPMCAGCVSSQGRGVLLFGPPNSGKTTASYLAAKVGMEFHADHSIFLDTGRAELQVWGDLFPAVFRPETLEFLPELEDKVRRSSHAGLPFCYLDDKHSPAAGGSVSPACALFLVRGCTHKSLSRLTETEALSELSSCLLFDEDPTFHEQVSEALTRITNLPAYRLQYGDDPSLAAQVVGELMRCEGTSWNDPISSSPIRVL